MLSSTPGKKLNKYTADYVVFDLETTGISCTWDSVIEISAVKVKNGKVVDEFSSLVNPGRPIPYAASAVNGITDDMVADSPSFEPVFTAFLEFVGDATLVGHNIASFDMKFLMRDAQAFWGQTVGNDYIDTLRLAKQYLPQLSHHRLVDLAEYYGISSRGAHRALNDCHMNQKVFEFLGEEMKKAPAKGILTCPRCGQVLKKRKGKFGEFYGCSGFPDCRYTKNV